MIPRVVHRTWKTHDVPKRFLPRVYTPEGMRWIAENDMSAVLLRHYPELAPALRGVTNAFAPWNRLPIGRKVARAPGHREVLAKRRSTAGPVDSQVAP